MRDDLLHTSSRSFRRIYSRTILFWFVKISFDFFSISKYYYQFLLHDFETNGSHWHGSFSRHSSLLWDKRIAVRITWNSYLVRMEFCILWLRMIFLLRTSLLLKRKIRQASLASSSSSSIEFAPLPVMTPDRRLRVICHHRDRIQFLMQLEPLQLRLLLPKPWTPDLLPLRPLAPTTAHLPNTAISRRRPRRCTTTTTHGSLCCRIWSRFWWYDFSHSAQKISCRNICRSSSVFRASGSLTGASSHLSVDGRPCCAHFWIHSLRSPLAANHFVVNNKLPDGSTDVALAYSTCFAVNPYFPGYRGAIIFPHLAIGEQSTVIIRYCQGSLSSHARGCCETFPGCSDRRCNRCDPLDSESPNPRNAY